MACLNVSVSTLCFIFFHDVFAHHWLQTISALFTPFAGMFDNRFKDARYMTGILLPGMEARIIREDGSEADYNEPGQLLLRGKNVAMGYWNNEKATKETFLPDGWLVTGDRFKADENGAF